MKITQMKSPNGHSVPNQFIITEEGHGALGNFIKRETFQSYESIIAIKTYWRKEDIQGIQNAKEIEVELDETYWNYSTTTGKYRNQFLGESRKETEGKINSGEYQLVKLNK